MTEDEKRRKIEGLTIQLKKFEEYRDKLQRDLCTTISEIEETRRKLRELGYVHPKAIGA